MNFKYSLIGLLVFSWSLIFGQTFRAGFIAGFNMTQVDGDDLGGYNRIGIVAGGRADALLAEKWKLSFEILFSQMGSDRSKYDFASDYENIRLNGVEVPVSFIFRDWFVDADEPFYRLEFEAGVSYYRLMNFKVEAFTGEDVSQFKDYDSNSFLLNLGATWFLNRRFGIHAHWAKGLNDFDKDPVEFLKSRNITIKTVYLF